MTLRFTSEDVGIAPEIKDIMKEDRKNKSIKDITDLICLIINGNKKEKECCIKVDVVENVVTGYKYFSSYFKKLASQLDKASEKNNNSGKTVIVINDPYNTSVSNTLKQLKPTKSVEVITTFEGGLVSLDTVADDIELSREKQLLVVQAYNREYGMEYSVEELEGIVTRLRNFSELVRGIIIDAKYSFLHYRTLLNKIMERSIEIPIWIVSQTNTSLASLPGVIKIEANPRKKFPEEENSQNKEIIDSGRKYSQKFISHLEKSLYLIEKEGIESWLNRHRRKAEIAHTRLPRYGFRPLYDIPEHRSIFVLSFKTPKGVSSFDIYSELESKGFIIDKPKDPDRITFSTMGPTTIGEFNALLENIILYAI